MVDSVNVAAGQQLLNSQNLRQTNERAEQARQDVTGQNSDDVTNTDTVEISNEAIQRQEAEAEESAQGLRAFLEENLQEALSDDSDENRGRLEVLA